MALSDEDVREILRIIDESQLEELSIETAEFTLHVRKGGERGGATSWPPRASTGGTEVASPQPTSPPKPADAKPHTEDDGLVTIEAPMLGTFYRAEGPGQEPFVEVGDRVEPDSTVCIIEVMKMMNSVRAGASGTVVEVCPENAELVEFGQPLFRVQPE